MVVKFSKTLGAWAPQTPFASTVTTYMTNLRDIYIKQSIIAIFIGSPPPPLIRCRWLSLSPFSFSLYPFIFWTKSDTSKPSIPLITIFIVSECRLPTTITIAEKSNYLFCCLEPKSIRISLKSNNFHLFLSHKTQIKKPKNRGERGVRTNNQIKQPSFFCYYLGFNLLKMEKMKMDILFFYLYLRN